MVSQKRTAVVKAPSERSTLLDWFFSRSPRGKKRTELPLGDSIVVAQPECRWFQVNHECIQLTYIYEISLCQWSSCTQTRN